MPRPRSPHWHDRDRCYYTKVDGQRVMLRHANGSKVGHGDTKGVREAVERLLAARDSLVKRAASPTVQDLCSDYLSAASVENVEDTMNGKEWILQAFCSFGVPPYGERIARDIDSTHLHRMRKEWEKKGYSGGTVRRLYREIMACWSWACRAEPERIPLVILESNPLTKLRLPAASPVKEKYVPLGTSRALIAFAAARAEVLTGSRIRFERQTVLMLRLIAETGCRPKEACSALWADLDTDQGLIVLDPKRHKTGKKTGKPRVIVVPPEILRELAALRSSGHAHPTHLFAHQLSRGEFSAGNDRDTGARWLRPGLTKWFRTLAREARAAWKDQPGSPVVPTGITLYWLRHSYLTDAQMGEGAERAADLAGNSKELARGTYLHVQASELRAVAERVAKRREPKGSDG